MPYQFKTVKDIPNWLDCPICGEYDTKHRSYLMNHFKKCEQYEGHIDDVLQYDLDKNTTVEDYIEQHINLINTTKKLIQTNELLTIQNQSFNEIILYIKNKVLQSISSYSAIEINTLDIYEFFFGESEESKKKQQDEFMIWIKSYREWND
jgi:hypothetical protein